METFYLRGEYITLGQLLKIAGLVESGGQAKVFLAEESVRVNGEPEARRGRKLFAGDRVEIEDVAPMLIAADPNTETAETVNGETTNGKTAGPPA